MTSEVDCDVIRMHELYKTIFHFEICEKLIHKV